MNVLEMPGTRNMMDRIGEKLEDLYAEAGQIPHGDFCAARDALVLQAIQFGAKLAPGAVENPDRPYSCPENPHHDKFYGVYEERTAYHLNAKGEPEYAEPVSGFNDQMTTLVDVFCWDCGQAGKGDVKAVENPAFFQKHPH